MKKMFLVFSIVSLVLCMMTGCGRPNLNGEKSEPTSAGIEHTEMLENGTGISSTVSVENAYYYDLLSDDENTIYALADNGAANNSKDKRAIVWKSSNRGEKWEEFLFQPDTIKPGSELRAGVLRSQNGEIEAYVVFSEHPNATTEVQHLYRITEDNCDEIKADEAIEQIGSIVWNISFVNEHTISLAGEKQCVLFDLNKMKPVKNLSYDPFTVGFLSMPEQFLIYGKEIVYCLDAETLEEQEAGKELQDFISSMFEKNDSLVYPPMDVYGDIVMCVTTEAIYEYREGKTVRTLSVPDMVNGGQAFNGMMPVCRGKDNIYYVSAFMAGGAELHRIEEDQGKKQDVFTIYSLENSPDITQIALLYQQEHPELKIDIRIGMEDEAALTRTDTIKKLNTELLAGEGPDIIFMDGLSVEKYADMGLLLPIKLNQPREKYFKNIIETYQKDDFLYAVPVGFWLYAVQGPEKMASETESPERMCRWILANAKKAGLGDYEYTDGYHVYAQYVQYIYDICAESMVQNGTANEEALKEYLDICGQLAKLSSEGLPDENTGLTSILPGTVEIYCNEEVEMAAGLVCGAADLAALITEQENKSAEYSLYPMYQPRDIIAINANTKQADIAHNFVEFSLGDSVQEVSESYFHPVALDAFYNATQGEGSEADEDECLMEIVLGEDEESFMVYRPEDDKIGSLEQKIKGIDMGFTNDVILRDTVMDTLKTYLSGTLPLEEAVSVAKNRINLYLGE